MSADQEYVVSRWGQRGVQYGCLAATPIYLLSALRGRGFSFRQLARYNWTVPVAGGLGGAGYGFYDASQKGDAGLKASATGMRMDRAAIRRDDLHLIGSVVGALALPALLLKRVGLVNGLLGGAGLGGAGGLIYNLTEKTDAESLKKEFQNLKDEGRKELSAAKREGEKGLEKIKDEVNKVAK